VHVVQHPLNPLHRLVSTFACFIKTVQEECQASLLSSVPELILKEWAVLRVGVKDGKFDGSVKGRDSLSALQKTSQVEMDGEGPTVPFSVEGSCLAKSGAFTTCWQPGQNYASAAPEGRHET
jgi:hypothetical protein